jgi:uncharacterized protein YbjT (DUF2867 family)
MRIAITGGTGFVGGHLAQRLAAEGHEIALIARGQRNHSFLPNTRFIPSDLMRIEVLANAFNGYDVVAHCAGINREIGEQNYQRVHIDATKNVINAARKSGIQKIVLMSFLRARPNCGSHYHESKWAAEELVRTSGLDYTIIKAGMVYGRGDHMLNHLSHSFHALPFLATVGFRQKRIRPLAIDDLINVLHATLIERRLTRQTVALTGAEELYLSEAARRVARIIGRKIVIVPAPVWFHYVLAQLFEWTMKIPLVAKAQIRILSEGVIEPCSPCASLPDDLKPSRRFAEDEIRKGLPSPGTFGLADLRCCLGHVV